MWRRTPIAFRTSKETIDQLNFIGGVIESDADGNSMFMNMRIRKWGDYS